MLLKSGLFFFHSHRRLQRESAVSKSHVISIRRWPVCWFPNWNWSPQNAAQQHNAASCACCTQHMRVGLVYQGLMFYLACVKVVQMCTGTWAYICVSNRASENTYQQSITNVIDELWQAAASWNFHQPKLLSYASACASKRLPIHMWMIFNSSDVTEPGHTRLNKKKRWCNLKPQAWMALL